MSQYINFYIKEKSGKRIPIGSYSRNSILFNHFRDSVTFEKTTLLDNNVLEQIIHSMENKVIEEKQLISGIQEHIKDICNYNNSASEKDGLILSCRETIKELNEYIDEYKYAMGVVRTYYNINDSLKYSEEEEWEGIEAGVEA